MKKRILVPIISPASAETVLFSQNRAALKKADLSSTVSFQFANNLETTGKNYNSSMFIRVENDDAKPNLPINSKSLITRAIARSQPDMDAKSSNHHTRSFRLCHWVAGKTAIESHNISHTPGIDQPQTIQNIAVL